MAEIRSYPFLRHLRAEPSNHVLRFRRGKLVSGGRGAAFWFHPLSTSLAEVPVDDREVPFLFRGRAHDFQDVSVQGVLSYRVNDAEKLAQRVDFAIHLRSGVHLEQPLDKIAGLLTELAQQYAFGYLARHELRHVLAEGVAEIRQVIQTGLEQEAGLEPMGLEVTAVRVSAVKPASDMEKALQVPVREAIQQEADEAKFRRRAEAVQKERAIQENELQTQIELARRESNLIEQRGENERRRVQDEAEAAHITTTAEAERTGIQARAKADSIAAVERSRVEAEQARMDIYRNFPTEQLLGLAAQDFAGKLQRIEHLTLTPDMLGDLVGRFAQLGRNGDGNGKAKR